MRHDVGAGAGAAFVEFPARPRVARVRGTEPRDGDSSGGDSGGGSGDGDGDGGGEFEVITWDGGEEFDDVDGGTPGRWITLEDGDGRRFVVPLQVAQHFGVAIGDDDDDDGGFRQPALIADSDESHSADEGDEPRPMTEISVHVDDEENELPRPAESESNE